MESIASSTSSGSSSMPPSPLPSGEYEVFLSFRGPDVRNTFADNLYTVLSRSKIRTFRDNEELRKGEEISPGLIRAIGESKMYIPILTEHYASSKWCLQELAQMVEFHKQGKGHLILPIFYFIDPRDVRNQQGPYQQAFEQHSQKYHPQAVKEWKDALQVVGKMKGWHVTESDGQGAVIDQVVSEVELHLRSIYTLVTDELVGINTHVEEVMKLMHLGSDNPKFIGIHGMGGIGKTTLSKAVYNKVSAQFDRCCFLENVRETLTRSDGVVCLQNKLISSILRHDYQVKDVSEGINVIKERVCKHKVLIILDDVDDKFEFDQILGNIGDFSLESRFIITTRDKRVLDILSGCELYEVSEMSRHYSFQLFSKHAFGMDYPPEDYATLTEEFVKVAAGLPLALRVIGSLLFRRERKFWEEKLIELQGIPSSTGNKVQERLKLSYNDLTHNEKQIFLDIACCFIGTDKELPYYMWSSCNYNPESGISTLVLRSLVKLDEENQFWMHDHLRDLGRAIVKEEDVRHPHKWSRIWSKKDAFDLLRSEEGNGRVEVLRIKMDFWEDLTDKAFKKLSELRYLEVWNGRVTGNFSKILPNLKCLRLCRCESVPSDVNMKKLVVLDLQESRVKDDWKGWKGMHAAHELKVLNLRGCTELKTAPDLSQCVSLESIDVRSCYGMKGGLYIGNSKNLKTLKLSRTELTELPDGIGMLQYLQEIDAQEANLTKLPVGMGKLSPLKMLQLKLNKYYYGRATTLNHQIMEVPRLPTSLKRLSISCRGGIPNLLELNDLEHLIFIRSHQPQIPGDLWQLPNLKELALYDSPCDGIPLLETQETTSTAAALPSSLTHLCAKDSGPLMRLPSLANLKRLTVLILVHFEAQEIHGLGELSALERMEIFYAPNLNKLDGLENLLLLTHLSVETCGMLEKVPSLANLIKLQTLKITMCRQLKDEFTGLERLVSLQVLHIEYCTLVCKLPPDLSELRKLKELRVVACRDLIDATGIGRVESLRQLCVWNCSSIKELPDLSGLKNLVGLTIKECTELTGVTGIQRLEKLRAVEITYCTSIKELEDLSSLKNLVHLDVSGCIELAELTGIERLQSLDVLRMSGCSSIKELPNLSGLKKLSTLDIRGCTQLTQVKGLEGLNVLLLRRDTKWGGKNWLQSTSEYGKQLVNRLLG